MGSNQARTALGAAALSAIDGEQRPLPLLRSIKALTSCAGRTFSLLWQRRISQPTWNLGNRIMFADGTTSEVYRETVIKRISPKEPVVLFVCFQLRWLHSDLAHRLFRMESELNTILFAGFGGLVSKLWLRHDQNGRYRGVYQWDGTATCVTYIRVLWWVLALVSRPETIHYAVLPGLYRDQVLADPSLIESLDVASGGWWRPVKLEPKRHEQLLH